MIFKKIALTTVFLLAFLIFGQNHPIFAHDMVVSLPIAYQNDTLGVQIADVKGLRAVEDGMLGTDSAYGFALVKAENGGNGTLVLSVRLRTLSNPDVNQAVGEVAIV